MTNTEKKSQFFSGNIFKAITGFILVLILLLPMSMVKDLIRERQNYHEQISNSLSKEWGADQTLKGPFLKVPYKYNYIKGKNKEGDKIIGIKTGHVIFLASDLKINGDVQTESKHRGIYHFEVYKANMNVSGEFNKLKTKNIIVDKYKLKETDYQWEEARLIFYLTELKGLSNSLNIKWNDSIKEVFPTSEDLTKSNYNNISYQGIYSEAPFKLGAKNTFSFSMKLKGSKSLNFIPMGKNSSIDIKSNWPHPMFNGSMLSESNHVTDKGFDAKWNISHLNRPIKQRWHISNKPEIENYKFGVTFIEPVNKYQKTIRSTKYSILFILLSFLTIFFVEVILKKESNFIQYILIGLALILFYSLLLSLTEQMSFNLAYLISSVAIIGLITVYSHSIHKHFKTTMSLFILWSILYGFLFSILQLEDYALLVGNIGLFIILAAIMFTSKKLNFNKSLTKPEEDNNVIDKGDSL